jgi:hypothetical protein
MSFSSSLGPRTPFGPRGQVFVSGRGGDRLGADRPPRLAAARPADEHDLVVLEASDW